MTPLHKPVTRRSNASYRGRRIVISLLPGDVLEFREERTRQRYLLAIHSAYIYAVQLAVERRKREKAAERKAKRGSHA